MQTFGQIVAEHRSLSTKAPTPRGGWAPIIIAVYLVCLIFVCAMYSLWFYNKDNLVCSHGINQTSVVCENTFEGYASVRVLRKSIV